MHTDCLIEFPAGLRFLCSSLLSSYDFFCLFVLCLLDNNKCLRFTSCSFLVHFLPATAYSIMVMLPRSSEQRSQLVIPAYLMLFFYFHIAGKFIGYSDYRESRLSLVYVLYRLELRRRWNARLATWHGGCTHHHGSALSAWPHFCYSVWWWDLNTCFLQLIVVFRYSTCIIAESTYIILFYSDYIDMLW
jgi:hypothetical protein